MENNQETKEERRKRLARERAKRIYAEKKDDILAYKRNKYDTERKLPKEQQQKRGRKPIEKTYNTPIINKKTKFTEDELINLINTDDEIKSNETKTFHTNNIKRFFKDTECEDLRCLKKEYKLAFNRLENGFNAFTGEAYLPQTIRHTLKTLSLVFNRYANNLITENVKTYLQNLTNKYTLISNDYYSEKQETIVYPSFKELIKKVKDRYGTDSKEYLIVKLYSELSIRDNFGNAPILEKPMTSREINYFVMTKKYTYFILNDYKTNNRYGSIKYTFSSEVNKLIRNYMENNNIQIGDALFEGNLSSFVSNMNKQLGYNNHGGINIFRHIRISELDGDDYDAKVKLLEQMGHSALTQPKYRRNISVKI